MDGRQLMKNFGKADGKQFSYFAVRLYCYDRNKVLEMCTKALPIRHYAFICHDKDIWKDSTEEHNAGDKKKAHYHLVLNMEQKISWKALQKKIYSVLGKECGAQLRDIKDTENATLYLTHNTKEAQKEGKYQYELSEVESDNYEYWLSEEAKHENKSEHVDAISEFVNVVIDNDNTIKRESMRAFQQEYGRDFILNFGKILQYLEVYTGRDKRTLTTDKELLMNAMLNNIMNKLKVTWQWDKAEEKFAKETDKTDYIIIKDKLLETESIIKEEINHILL